MELCLFLPMDIELFQHDLLKSLAFIDLLHTFVKNLLAVIVGACFWIVYSVPGIDAPVLPPTPHDLGHDSCRVSLEISQRDSSHLLFLFQNCSIYSNSFASHKYFRVTLSVSAETLPGFDRNCIKPLDRFTGELTSY